MPLIRESQNAFFFYFFYTLSATTIILVLGLFLFLCIRTGSIDNEINSDKGKEDSLYLRWEVYILRILLNIIFWAFCSPFIETLISAIRCEGVTHDIDTSMICFEGVHIFLIILSSLLLLILMAICSVTALFFHTTQIFSEDALARIDTSHEICLLFYRLCIAIFPVFLHGEVGNWVFICLALFVSFFFVYEYFLNVPYFDSIISIIWGSLMCNYSWISLNALLMMILDLYGHIIIIAIGIPIMVGLVVNLRELRIHNLKLLNLDKMKSESDAVFQIVAIQKMIQEASLGEDQDLTLIGIVNLHVLECQNLECPCKTKGRLFDATSGQFSEENVCYHKNQIFLKHFVKRLYEEAINKFFNSSLLHIVFSYYLLETMGNTHTALIELSLGSKKKPSLQQQFTIFRYKHIIQMSIYLDSTGSKDIYSQLINVIEFEQNVNELQKIIEKICTLQIDFWSQIANQLPDLNIMNDLGEKIFSASQEAEVAWTRICRINQNYPKAMNLFANYMIEIKNHNQIGFELLEKAKQNTYKKSLHELIKSPDILFADDTVVIHISGEKENIGKITQTNSGLTKIFGYSKTEVLGHGVNILMPPIIAKRHTNFLEIFFTTGFKTVFNIERVLFGMHRNGFCFAIKLIVKQIPNLKEGTQYVGMVRQNQGDCEYILTDMRGVVDSFSSGITSLLNLPSKLFKEADVNIQVLAPDLINIFSLSDKKRNLLDKFKEPGGQKLMFYVPKDFSVHIQSEIKKNNRDIGKVVQNKNSPNSTYKKTKHPLYQDFNKDLNKHKGIAQKALTMQQLLQSAEYQEYETKSSVRCEIIDHTFGELNQSIESLKLRVFKITGFNIKKAAANIDLSSEDPEASGNLSGSNISNQAGNLLAPFTIFSKEESNKNILNFVNQPSVLDIREDTKITEKMPGQTITTESRVATQEAAGLINMAIPNSLKSSEKKQNLIAIPEESKMIIESSQDVSQTQKNIQEEDKFSEKSTPRIDLGQMQGPEVFGLGSHAAEDNSIIPPEDFLSDSGSHKSTGKVNKNLKMKISTKNPNQHFKSSSNLPFVKKPQTKAAFATIFSPRQPNSDEKKEIGNSKIESEIKEEEVPLNKGEIDKQIALKLINANSKSSKARKLQLSENESAGGQKNLSPQKDSSPQKEKNDPQHRSPALPNITNKSYTAEEQQVENTNIPNIPLDKRNIEEIKISMAQRRSIKKKFKYNSKIFPAPSDIEPNSDPQVFEYKPTEEEVKLRKSLLSFAKKLNKDKKKEEKKIEEKKEVKENADPEEEEEEEDEEEEEVKQELIEEVREAAQDDNQDTQSSITSGSTSSTMRSFYSLRAAIDEKYIPSSVRNLRCSANIVFFLLFGIAIVFFIMQVTLYNKIETNVHSINYSEKRIEDIIDLGLQITQMILVTADAKQHRDNSSLSQEQSVLYENLTTTFQSFTYLKGKTEYHASELRNSQTSLGLQTAGLSSDSLKKTNPTAVFLSYLKTVGSSTNYSYTLWEAVMEIVVSSYRIASMDVYQVDETMDATVYFVLQNSLNNVMINLYTSSIAIMEETESSRNFNVIIFLILLCVASFALLLSSTLLIPVVNKVKKSKQEVLMLFMRIKKGDATEELNKCRKFLGTFQSNQETELIAAEIDEGPQEVDEEPEEDRVHNRKLEKNKVGTSRRKYKLLVINLGPTYAKFIFLILIMEAYFILEYFLSYTFLNQVSSLTDELQQLISRKPAHSIILLSEKIGIYKNYNITITNQNAKSFISFIFSAISEAEEKLLDIFTGNKGYHSSSYNSVFNNLMYSNLCENVPEFVSIQSTCENFNEGILKKGIYSTVIKYLDFLRQLNQDYSESPRTSYYQYKFLNDQLFAIAGELQSKYLNVSMNLLASKMNEEIKNFFSKEDYQNDILFSIYVIYLITVYNFFWRNFISSMQDELWQTKSLLSILSPEIIMNIPEIKTFILENSSTVLLTQSHKR